MNELEISRPFTDTAVDRGPGHAAIQRSFQRLGGVFAVNDVCVARIDRDIAAVATANVSPVVSAGEAAAKGSVILRATEKRVAVWIDRTMVELRDLVPVVQ